MCSLIALVYIRAGALLGMFVRNRLPKGHLDAAHEQVNPHARTLSFMRSGGFRTDQESAESGNHAFPVPFRVFP
jgi:hypothetical protein